MPDLQTVAVFCAASLALIALPGPAVLYVVARSAEQGRRAGLASVLGVATGSLLHVAAAAVGLSAVLASSAVAFSVVRYAGAAYLVWLGIRTLRERPSTDVIEVVTRPLGRVFTDGVVVNALNPKTALFFLAFLPQFVGPGAPVPLQLLVLGLLFTAIGVVSDGVYALLAATAGGWMRRRASVRRWVTGGVYLGLGAVAATSGSGRAA